MQDNKNEFEQIKEAVLLWLNHWYYFVVSMIICVAFAFIYLKVKAPVMKVSTQVILRYDESLIGSPSVGKGQSVLNAFGLGGRSQSVEDESLKMGSHGYVKKIVKKFDLNFDYTKKEYFGLLKTKLYDKSPLILSADKAISDTIAPVFFTLDLRKEKTIVKMKRGRKTLGKYEVISFPSTLETPSGTITISKSAYYDQYKKPMKISVFYANYDFMAQIYQKAIEVDFEKKTSDIIHIDMNTENVVLAKKILNEVIATYNSEWESDKEQVSFKTLFFIDERLKAVSENLKKADQAIQNFKDHYNLTEIEVDVKYYLAMSGELQPAILEAESQLKMVDLIVSFVKDEKNKYAMIPFSLTTANSAMSEVLVKYNELLTKRNEMYRSNAQSALVKMLGDQVESQRETLLQSVDNVKKGLQITVENLKKKEAEVNAKIGKIPAIEKDYLYLKRDQELQQRIYIFLLEMREESGVKGISLFPKLKVIDEPYAVNKPVEPNLMKIALMVLFFGGVAFPLAAIYGFPLIKNYIRRRKEK